MPLLSVVQLLSAGHLNVFGVVGIGLLGLRILGSRVVVVVVVGIFPVLEKVGHRCHNMRVAVFRIFGRIFGQRDHSLDLLCKEI